jgi:hypothetical protein
LWPVRSAECKLQPQHTPTRGYDAIIAHADFIICGAMAPIEDVCRGLYTRVCPLFVLNAPGQPFLIGSGIPMQIGRVSVIATAAHVLRPYGEATVLTLGATRAVDLTGDRRGFGYIVGKTADVDVALIVLNDEERTELRRHYEFWYSVNFVKPRDIGSGALYAVFGYPQSQNKMSPRLKGSNRAVGNFYVSPDRVSVAEMRLPGKFEAVHFALVAPPKSALSMDGRRTNFPTPSGVSGGAVMRLDFSHHPAVAPTPRLAGMLIEHHKKPGAFICTRIEAVETMVRELI